MIQVYRVGDLGIVTGAMRGENGGMIPVPYSTPAIRVIHEDGVPHDITRAEAMALSTMLKDFSADA